MDKVLLKDLKKQDKFTKFFRDWKEQQFQGEIDEQKLKEELLLLSNTIGMQEGLLIACFDYRNLNLAFFTGNVEELTGYPESMFRNKGMETSFAMIHPDDRPELFNFQKIVFEVFHSLSISERHTFQFSYTTRWVHRKTQEITWVTAKVRPYVIDEAGNFIMDLHIIIKLFTPPKLKGYDWNYSFTKDDGTKIFVSKNSPTDKEVKLTGKEREIVDLILQGKESKEISEILNISLNTVGTHRKNILRKLGAKNVGEMVKILASYDF
ncbi:LuxR C-terminal-related transcriptional regulator [Algoriphagus sp. AK58]|uniref:LuxR C-terminal-related transcriptional regulator n=1 Tax=Algoriphagus sp. AK58 TaxID=1406877 RepID=UPI0016509AF1|nr:LuxR C-terminal-related transcriptional regulator [Algoriphagus sp. AK58]MBC6365385.1 helix-turn-helix transcriptional regulator [Algoriphagus sp. AK58]